MTSTPGRTEHANIHLPPPFILAAAFLLGWLVHRWRPLRIVPASWADAADVIGVVTVLAGLGFTFWGMATFVHHRTTVLPMRPTTKIVQSGPYRFSRNPMYVGLTAAYVGVVLFANMLWPLVMLPLALLALVHFVIAREERYLVAAFGEEYRGYRSRVRRWL